MLKAHTALFAGLSGLLVLVWATTTRAYFWPVHAVLALVLAVHGWVVLDR